MHIFSSIVLIVGAVILLIVGLIRVLHELLERGPHDAPLIEEDGLAWPPRYRGTTRPPSVISSDVRGGANGLAASSNWPSERERSQT